MPSLAAFLHHVAAFTLVAALAVQFVLLRGELTAQSARRLRVADAVLGASAGIVLVIGLLRVVYFEKGAAYYFHNLPFLLKLTAFILLAVLSIYPTMTFLGWKGNDAPAVAPQKLRLVRRLVHWELAGVVVILLCAALMARGIGQL